MKTTPELNENIMKTLDNGNLLRGLLLLIKTDKNIWDHELRIFVQEGVKLGYDKEFCENSIRNVLRNKHINQSPPVFFYKANAIKFLRVAMSIIKEDFKPNVQKLKFLEEVALVNDLARHWKILNYKISDMHISAPENIMSDNIYA